MPQTLPLIAQPDLASQVNAVERDGYVYLPAVLDARQTAELRAHMDRLQPNPESFDRGLEPERDGFVNRHINNAFNRDPHFVRFLDYPGVIEIAEALHGTGCHVIGMTSWQTGPGRPDQTLHADWQPLELPEDVMADPRVRIPVYISTAHFYLDDMTEELGPTRFVPGSHRAGRAPNGDTGWKGARNRASCARRATWCCSAARCGTAAPPTTATGCATCCRCTTRNAGSRSAFRPTCTGSRSIPISWPSPATANAD